MPTISQDLLPALCEFVAKPGQDGVKIALIDAPPASGKSTQLVPDLWNATLSTRPGAHGWYILGHPTEARILKGFLQQSKSVEAVLDKYPGTPLPDAPRDARLFLGSYNYFRSVLERQTDTLCSDLVLFLDLELIPTVDGETIFPPLVRFIKMLRRRASQDETFHMNITILLLGWGIRPAINYVLETSLDVETDFFSYTSESPNPSSIGDGLTYSEMLARARDTISKRLADNPPAVLEEGEVLRGPPGPCMLLFMFHDDARQNIVEPLQTAHAGRFSVHWLSAEANWTTLTAAIEDPRHKLICIEPGMPFRVYIPNIRGAISSCSQVARVFDPLTSQSPLARRDVDNLELWSQRAWIHGSSDATAGIPFDMICANEWYAQLSRTRAAASHGDLSMMMLLTFDTERGESDFDVPVPAFYEVDEARLRDTRRRLVHTQALQMAATVPRLFTLTDIGKEMVLSMRLPGRKALDLDITPQVAQILARIRLTAGLSDRSKRVLIRFAAILRRQVGQLFFLTETGVQSCKDGQVSAVVEDIKECCAGASSMQYINGSLWIALGLWQKQKINGGLEDEDGPDFVHIAGGKVGFGRRAAREISTYVQALEEKFDLAATSNRKELLSTLLTTEDRSQVNEVLAWSHMHQMVLFPMPPSTDAPVDIASLQPVDVNLSLPLPIDLAPRLLSLARGQANDGFVGIYHSMMLATSEQGHDVLLILDLTLIPNWILRKLEQCTGKSLTTLVTTVYPVPTNVGQMLVD